MVEISLRNSKFPPMRLPTCKNINWQSSRLIQRSDTQNASTSKTTKAVKEWGRSEMQMSDFCHCQDKKAVMREWEKKELPEQISNHLGLGLDLINPSYPPLPLTKILLVKRQNQIHLGLGKSRDQLNLNTNKIYNNTKLKLY